MRCQQWKHGDGFTNNFFFAAPSTMTLEIPPNPGTATHNWSPQNTQWPATVPDGMEEKHARGGPAEGVGDERDGVQQLPTLDLHRRQLSNEETNIQQFFFSNIQTVFWSRELELNFNKTLQHFKHFIALININSNFSLISNWAD